MITIDFETYYNDTGYGLKSLTTEEYIRDPRFEVIGVSVAVGDAPAVWLTPEAFTKYVPTVNWSQQYVLAHHAHFDGFILSHHYGVRPKFWYDTLSMARLLHGTEVGGSLAALAEAYGVGAKGDEVINAINKHVQDFTLEEYARYGQYCCNDVELTRSIFNLMRDRVPSTELKLIDMTVRMFTEPEFEGDQLLLFDTIKQERQRKQELLDRSSITKEKLMSNDEFAQLLLDFGETPPMKDSPRQKLPNGMPKQIPAFGKTDPGMQALLEHPREEIRWLAEARLAVKSTIVETRSERFLRTAERGKIPVYLKYWGAHTGRWSGGDKMNPQNLNRGGVLRDALRAPPGTEVVAIDSAQIEARVLAWLAGESWLVEAFAAGRDVYSEFASMVYGRTITKQDKTERFVGKTAVLGLGYSLGHIKFARTMLAAGVQFTDADAQTMQVDVAGYSENKRNLRHVRDIPSRLPLPALLTHCAVAKKIVDTYRQRNPRIVDLWSKMNAAIEFMATGVRRSLGGVITTGTRVIRLPNGTHLRYPGLEQRYQKPKLDPETQEEIEPGGNYWSYMNRKDRVRIYGGALTENVVQALARIIVAGQALRIQDELGAKIATTTHDEVVCVVPKGRGNYVLAAGINIMSTPPEWAKGLPLSAEGGVGERYGDAK